MLLYLRNETDHHITVEGLVEVQEVLGKAKGATRVLVTLEEGIPNAHQPRLNLQRENLLLINVNN